MSFRIGHASVPEACGSSSAPSSATASSPPHGPAATTPRSSSRLPLRSWGAPAPFRPRGLPEWPGAGRNSTRRGRGRSGSRAMPNELWFPFYPSRFMAGIRGLSANEVKVYIALLCRIYEHNGPIPWKPEILATYCEIRPSSFDKALDRLLRLEKLYVTDDGRLSNETCDEEISQRSSRSENARRAGQKSAEKTQRNQRARPAGAERPTDYYNTEHDDDDGDARARPREAPRSEPTHRERLLEAMGADPATGLTGPNGRILGTQSDMEEAGRWADDLGLSEDDQLSVVREVMARKAEPGPPVSFRYFTPAMRELAGARNAPRLSPAAPKEGSAAPHPMPRIIPQLPKEYRNVD
ncbi:hypothetical protein C2I36_09545 [Rhodobacteraceae bacterium WD3A24]|nr:hypothetical protein C2I36_09545 [Rhodobacteraceae bacterium WD3A24]